MKNYFFATHLTFHPPIRTASWFNNVLIRLLRRSNVLYFPDSFPKRSPACSRTSLTRIIFSYQFHSQPIRIVIETSCLVSFSRTRCVLQTIRGFHSRWLPRCFLGKIGQGGGVIWNEYPWYLEFIHISWCFGAIKPKTHKFSTKIMM